MSESERKGRIVHAGLRTLTKHGDSVGVTLPKREAREVLDVDLDDVEGESVPVRLRDNGQVEVDLPAD